MRIYTFLITFVLVLFNLGWSQTLTVSSGGQAGPTFTNITITSNTWTLTGNATVTAGAIQTALSQGSLTIKGNSNTFEVNVNQSISASTAGSALTFGDTDNTSTITIGANISNAGPLNFYGGAIALNANISTTNSSAILVKAKSNINQASSVVVSTSGGSVSYWADSDDNSTGYVQLKSSSSISTNGGAISLGGGSDLTTDFAFGTTAELCSEVSNLYIAGIHMQTGSQLNSGGGHISVRGQNASNATSNMAFGVSLKEVTMNSGVGKIAIHGVATGSGNVNAQGASAWSSVTLRSANTTADAISVIGDASAINMGTNGVSLGINFTGLFEATASGGGITFDGRAGSANTVAGTNLSGSVLALSGPITILGESTNNVDPIYIGSEITIGKKAATNVTTSSSNVVFEANAITLGNTSHLIDCSGTFTFRPRSNSFPTALSWPIANLTLASSVSGLTLGKSTNTADITLASATSINGPVNFYGGQININQNLTSTGGATGDVLLKASSNIIEASSQVITTNAGDVTLWADSDGNGTGYIYITGGSGSGISSGGGAIFLGGGTNLATGYAKGSETTDTGTDNSGISGVHLRSGSSLLSGGGNITLRGENVGSSFQQVQAGVMGAGTTLDAGGGKIAIYGKAAGSGNSNAQGISRAGNDNWTIKSSNSSSDAIQLIGDASLCNGSESTIGVNFIGNIIANGGGGILLDGTAGIATGHDHGLDVRGNILANSGTITLKGQNNTASDVSVFLGTQSGINLSTTLGSKSGTLVTASTSPIIIQGDNIDFNTSAPVNTTGSLTIQPVNTSFTSALSFPITNLTVSNTIGGLTLGKSGNTADITIGSATSVAGSINLYGGTIGLNAGLSTTNMLNGNISLNGTSLSGNSNIALAQDRILTCNLSSPVTYSGVISGTGSGLTQAGTGVLTLTGANTFTGTTTVAAGGLTLNRTGGGTLASVTNLSISGGALVVNSNQVVNDINLSSGTLTNNAGVTLTLENTFAGGGTLANNGTFKILGTTTAGPMSPPAIEFPGASTTVSAMNNLTVDNLLGVNLNKNMSVAGTLHLAAGTFNLTSNTLTVNGSLTRTSGAIYASAGTISFGNPTDLSLPTSTFSGNILNFNKMNGAGTLTVNENIVVTNNMSTSASIGDLIMAPSKELTVQGTLTNNGTFTLKDGATFVQSNSGTSITGGGTFNVEKQLTGNTGSWTNTNGRFWYVGVPMVSVARNNYGTPGASTNQVWSYTESTKQYTTLNDGNTLLSAGTGYVHRRDANGTLIFSANGSNGLYRSDLTVSSLTKTAGNTAGVHLISNPYMAYIDWELVHAASTNIDPTFYIRTNNSSSNNISAIISYNASTHLETNNSSVSASAAQLRYIAPLQSIWVRVLGNAGATGTVNMTRGMLSHQSGNVGLKSSTIFPTLARVNLVDGNNFDQLLVYLNSDMSNEVDEYDSEKTSASGAVQIYTMSSNKKLVMNGLRNNKKKVSVPLYLELPETKSYTLQLSEFQLEDGLILLEDKQEGTIQDFTINENYTFFANSGLLQNRFVLHFILPNAELTTQGPSNNWVEEETSYAEGGDLTISNDAKGKVQIQLDQPETEKIEGTVQASDVNGKIVYSGILEGALTTLELHVPAGIYYLTVQSGTLIEKKKVFIQD